jgi:hypothetical protein
MQNLLNSFIADAGNMHRHVEENLPPVLVCLIRLCEVFVGLATDVQ